MGVFRMTRSPRTLYCCQIMRPISEMPAAEARELKGLLFDLDDTVLDHGALTEAAFRALCALSASGLALICVTGRPAGWGQVLMRQWPLAGMITENGALALLKRDGQLSLVDRLSSEQRAERSARLRALHRELLAHFPDLVESDGGLGRISDIAYDVAEHQKLPQERIAAIIDLAEARGARTQVSSIHLHVSFDCDDKASGALRFLELAHGVEPTLARHSFAFIGDSANDAAAFAAFKTTIGVANLRGLLTLNPRYTTRAGYGRGFAEAAYRLLELRSAATLQRHSHAGAGPHRLEFAE